MQISTLKKCPCHADSPRIMSDTALRRSKSSWRRDLRAAARVRSFGQPGSFADARSTRRPNLVPPACAVTLPRERGFCFAIRIGTAGSRRAHLLDACIHIGRSATTHAGHCRRRSGPDLDRSAICIRVDRPRKNLPAVSHLPDCTGNGKLPKTGGLPDLPVGKPIQIWNHRISYFSTGFRCNFGGIGCIITEKCWPR